MRKIKVVVLLVQQLQHGFTKNAKVSPNLTVAQMRSCCVFTIDTSSMHQKFSNMISIITHYSQNLTILHSDYIFFLQNKEVNKLTFTTYS